LTTAQQGAPTVFTPPDAKYEKILMKDLSLRTSSFKVRWLSRRYCRTQYLVSDRPCF
jgi:hypothetical protein